MLAVSHVVFGKAVASSLVHSPSAFEPAATCLHPLHPQFRIGNTINTPLTLPEADADEPEKLES